jgi:hypothetical protein
VSPAACGDRRAPTPGRVPDRVLSADRLVGPSDATAGVSVQAGYPALFLVRDLFACSSLSARASNVLITACRLMLSRAARPIQLPQHSRGQIDTHAPHRPDHAELVGEVTRDIFAPRCHPCDLVRRQFSLLSFHSGCVTPSRAGDLDVLGVRNVESNRPEVVLHADCRRRYTRRTAVRRRPIPFHMSRYPSLNPRRASRQASRFLRCIVGRNRSVVNNHFGAVIDLVPDA